MDFITHLSPSNGHTVIWVIVDRLTKYAHFVALPSKFSAEILARRFLQEICRLDGVPKTIVSNRDKLFFSTLWRELFRVLGTSLCYSTAYHPQSAGQTEVVNRCLQTYLRCFSGTHPTKWNTHLSLAEYWYNTSCHSSLHWIIKYLPIGCFSVLRVSKNICQLNQHTCKLDLILIRVCNPLSYCRIQQWPQL
ncbi:hypothetical protein TanjilG_16821 [Lupinus angustifolius]|uniref:Integrase catalytic domain-containing protein n=1 Tax=Lupinus angustifolius TaxID=3871 RepID=A0A1J7HVH4_LUPAN|nr:hypothetical protein TanjilG_16821 [Lupinus angustifolius]